MRVHFVRWRLHTCTNLLPPFLVSLLLDPPLGLQTCMADKHHESIRCFNRSADFVLKNTTASEFPSVEPSELLVICKRSAHGVNQRFVSGTVREEGLHTLPFSDIG